MNSSNNPNLLLISENSIPIVEMLDNCPSEFSDFAKRSCINDIYTRETMGAFLRRMGILYNTQHPGWMPQLEIWIKAVEQSIDATSKLYQLQKILNISSKPEGPYQLKTGDNYYSSLFISHTIWIELHDIIQIYFQSDKNSESGVVFYDLVRTVSPKGERILDFLLFSENTYLFPTMLQRHTKLMQEKFTNANYFKTTFI